MKTIKIILTVLTIIFIGLGFFQILSFDISNPLMLTSLATLLLVRGIEFKQKRDKSGFILMLVEALLLYIIVIYIVFGR